MKAMRICNRCSRLAGRRVRYPLSAFSKKQGTRDGLHNDCRSCVSDRRRAARLKQNADCGQLPTLPFRPDRLFSGQTGQPLSIEHVEGVGGW